MPRISLAVAVALTLASGVAHAAKFSTPVVGAGAGRFIQCIATNVGAKPVTISIKLYDVDGNEIAPNAYSCAASPIGPNATCLAQTQVGQVASCIVQSSSRSVRAAAEVFSGPNIVAAVPATAR